MDEQLVNNINILTLSGLLGLYCILQEFSLVSNGILALIIGSVVCTVRKYAPTRVTTVLGLCYGDEGKGKVTKALSDEKSYIWYNRPLKDWIIDMKKVYCIRFGGANNAGHTVKFNGETIVTHSVPTGIVHSNTTAIIGKGCLVNPKALKEEMTYLREHGINGDIYVDVNAQVITEEHIQKDIESETKLATGETTVSSGANGSTKKGVRFCASDKALRTGKRVKDCLDDFADVPGFIACDGQEMLMKQSGYFGHEVYAEGAQAYGLDPDTGRWPYVTSTGCNLSQVLTFGILTKWLGDVWGVAKFPVTYVGSADYMRKLPSGEPCPDLVAFQKFPSCLERGSTTNRWRQVDYPNMIEITKAINHNSVTHLVINKMDVIEDIFNGDFPENPKADDPEFSFPEQKYPDILSLIIDEADPIPEHNAIRSDLLEPEHDYYVIRCKDIESYKQYIETYIHSKCPTVKKIIFSYSPDKL